MKTAKRVLAVLVAIVMMIGTCAVAASAAGTLQAQIDGGATKVTLTKNTTETLTVKNGTVTIDLNGYALTGVDGSAAIKVQGGNVTVTNGQVLAVFGKMSTEEMLKNVSNHCPPAIQVTGGELTVDGVRIIGGQIRVPTTPINNPTLVPAGSGIMSYNNAPVTIKRCSIYGDYGVNNAVRTSVPGGVVTVEDAVILAYDTAIKGEYAIAAGSEEIDAADRICGTTLADGSNFEDIQKEAIHNAIDGRSLVVTKTPEQLIEEKKNDAVNPVDLTPVIKVIDGVDKAEVNAPVIDYCWPNTKGTDCSYKLVPEKVVLSDGSSCDLDAVEAAYVDEDAQVMYRIEYKMGDEAKPYIQSIVSEDPNENPLVGCLGWAGLELEERYAEVMNNSTPAIDSYQEVVNMLGDLMKMLDEAGATTITFMGQEIHAAELDEFKQLRKALYAIGGATAFNAKFRNETNPDNIYEWTENQYKTIFMTDEAMPQYVGTLDRVAAIIDQLNTYRPFTNTAKWADLAYWLYDSVYPELIDKNLNNNVLDDENILKEFVDRVSALVDLLTVDEGEEDSTLAQVVSAFNMDESTLGLINTVLGYAKKAQTELNKALKNVDVTSTLDYIKNEKANIKDYVNQIVYAVENYTEFVDPADYVEGDFVKMFATRGDVIVDRIAPDGNLHLTIAGGGVVNYSAIQNGTVTTDVADIPFNGGFTLRAVPDEDYEFLFWVSKENSLGRIVSTEPTFTMSTTIDRDIQAVFNYVDYPVAYFTNPMGAISGIADAADVNTVSGGYAEITIPSDAATPTVAGYGFAGWPGVTNGKVLTNASDNFAYFAGNSAFATSNAYYGTDGAILKVNSNSASFIITSAYSKAGGYTVTFNDAGKTYTASGNYSDVATKSSDFGAPSYWVVDDGTDLIYSVNNVINYTIIDNMTFKSVQGECPQNYALRISKQVESDKVVFYAERCSKSAFKSTGIVFSVGDANTVNTMPTIGGANCSKMTASFNTLEGVYSTYASFSWLNGRTIYVRPFIEYANGQIVYGDASQVVHYPSN